MKSPQMYKKILIINIFGIGDVLFTTPIIANIKKYMPDAVIGYVCNKRTADVLKNNSKIDKVFIYEKDDFRDLFKNSKKEYLRKFFGLLSEIKKEDFDLVIDVSLNKYSSFLLWLAGIKERIGFNYKNRSPFLTKKIKLVGYENKHVVEYYLDLLDIIGIPSTEKNLEFYVSQHDAQWADQYLKDNGISDTDKIIAIVPGGGASWGKDAQYKRWPVENYVKLADKIVEKTHYKIILLGGPSEEELCQSMAQTMKHRPLNICGKTSLGQLAAFLKRSRLAIVNDGGPLHVAVGLNVKTVSIFGPVDEIVYGPYPKGSHIVVSKEIVCRPCYRRFRVSRCAHYYCLKTLSVDDVLAKIRFIFDC